jgi:three-Cys-motif partner protein
MTDAQEFFREKKPWSRYKDLILDYYLEPYLAKVATLGRPILVVDCFAGAGQFEDGESGSPLIISKKLKAVQDRGVEVLGFYVEKDPALYDRLKSNTQDLQIPVRTAQGDFRQYVDEIATLAKDRTVFVYLDPLRPSDLLFTDMESVYRQLESGRSVEVLINFMGTGFLRAALGLSDHIFTGDILQAEHPLVIIWNAVAGGTYWQDIIFTGQTPDVDRIEQLAEGYGERLRQWFTWIIRYPVRDNYEDKLPKYHLMFGSRHPDAIDLMNRAMVKARREFVGSQFVKGYLFPNQPEREVVDPAQIEKTVISTSRLVGRVKWKELRIRATVANPCMYNDSEFNGAIKRLIERGTLKSDCTGKRIEDGAWVWPP